MELFLPELDLGQGMYSQCEDGHDRVNHRLCVWTGAPLLTESSRSVVKPSNDLDFPFVRWGTIILVLL